MNFAKILQQVLPTCTDKLLSMLLLLLVFDVIVVIDVIIGSLLFCVISLLPS